MIYSKYWKIRYAVAYFGRDKGIDILVHDDSNIIKITVGEFKRVKDLEILKNDNNDTVRLLALHSLDSLKVGKEVQIESFDKNGNQLSKFSGKLYNARCPIYNKYLKNKKLLNVYLNNDVKTYHEDSVIIYDDKLKPDYSFIDNKISKLSIEDMSELHTIPKHRCFLLHPPWRIILLLKLNVLHKVHKRKFGLFHPYRLFN